jgi:hypothetical protein
VGGGPVWSNEYILPCNARKGDHAPISFIASHELILLCEIRCSEKAIQDSRSFSKRASTNLDSVPEPWRDNRWGGGGGERRGAVGRACTTSVIKGLPGGGAAA